MRNVAGLSSVNCRITGVQQLWKTFVGRRIVHKRHIISKRQPFTDESSNDSYVSTTKAGKGSPKSSNQHSPSQSSVFTTDKHTSQSSATFKNSPRPIAGQHLGWIKESRHCYRIYISGRPKKSPLGRTPTATSVERSEIWLPRHSIRLSTSTRPLREPKLRPRNARSLKMKSHIQFVTTPTSDTPGTALILHFDDKRYIFGNVHEGLQRAGLEFGIKFLKSKDIFLTGRTEWKTNGGLLGLTLTLADASKSAAASRAELLKAKTERKREREEEESQRPKKTKKDQTSEYVTKSAAKRGDNESVQDDQTLRIHGGPNITHVLATARSFVFRQGMPLDVDEYIEEERQSGEERQWEPTWKDDRIQVWAMPIKPLSGEGSRATQSSFSARKRSLGDYMQGQRVTRADLAEPWASESSEVEAAADHDQSIRQFVVNEMFQSHWSFDKLVKTPLHQVRLPAKLFTRDPETKKLMKYEGGVPDGTTPVPNIDVLVREPWPGALIEHLPPTRRSSVAMSYIVRNHRQRGKFRPDEARRLNVPPGPSWSCLTKGISVQSTDGNTITPEMVLEPGKDGNGVAIIDLPSVEYIPDLLSRLEWQAEKVHAGVGAIIWLLGPGVIRDPTLLAFVEEFKDLQHIVSSVDECPDYLSMNSAAAEALRHNMVDPARYPLLQHNNASSPGAQSSRNELGNSNWVAARRGLKVQLEPAVGVDAGGVAPPFDAEPVRKEISRAVIQSAQDAQDEIGSVAAQITSACQNLPSPDSEIICLGTGSAMPSKHRNVAGTLLRVPGYGSYLFDCGENTFGQLKRIYSPSELEEVFQDLKMIWISHLHADHHLGTASVIKAWYETVHGKDIVKRPNSSIAEQLLRPTKYLSEKGRLFVVSCGQMMRWLEEYSSVEEIGYDRLIPLESRRSTLEWNGLDVSLQTAKNSEVKNAMQLATGLTDIQTCFVSHCFAAQAISITFSSGFKFSYSGDCRPSQNFAAIGKGSTVLLHEATFDDEMKVDAIAKKHSTTSEAIGVGVAMGARRILLTHFSQRYNKIPTMSDLDRSAIRLEDAEDTDESQLGADAPVDAEADTEVETSTSNNNDISEYQRTEHLSTSDQPNNSTQGSTSATSAIPNEPIPLPAKNTDLKVAVAFDYMRVLVKDIAHLEKFTPALRELYREEEDTAIARKAGGSAALADKESDTGNGKKQEPTQKVKQEQGEVKTAKERAEKKEKWERDGREKAEGVKHLVMEANGMGLVPDQTSAGDEGGGDR